MVVPKSQPPDSSLPSKQDFNANSRNLDAKAAWEHFGGLTLDEAKKKFCDCPGIYQEDFMFMGAKAFAFYFPVIESYLRETVARDDDADWDDRQAWILAHGILLQFKSENSAHVDALSPRVLDLATFVRQNLALFNFDQEEQQRLETAWKELQDCVATRPTNSAPPLTAPKRSWFKFSLRTLFLLVGLFGTWLGCEFKTVRDRQSMAQFIEDHKGSVRQLHEWQPFAVHQYSFDVPPEPRISLLRRWLGDDTVLSVVWSAEASQADIDRAMPFFPEAESIVAYPEVEFGE